jgi:hypothetical protein
MAGAATRPLRIEVSRRVIERFKRAAREAFPRETFAFLVGQDAGDLVIVEDLFIPEDVAEWCTRGAVYAPPQWEIEARIAAAEDGAKVVGDIHSHPRPYEVWRGQLTERTPSEGDHAIGWRGICGICVVSETRNKKRRASVRFYGPAWKVEEKVIDV